MAQTEFEFMGNDRYIKYKYAQETTINISTVTETWEIESSVSVYKATTDYLKRSLNIKAIFEGHKINIFESDEIYTDPDVFNNANIIVQAIASSFFYGREKYFSPTPVFGKAKLIIVSGPPKKVLTTSLSFLNMDTQVLILTGLTLVLLSLFLVVHSIVIKKYKLMPTKKVVKKLVQETLENVWENASLLCAEPIPSVLPHITRRLLAASWLIGVTFILFFLGCYLRTEFTKESYNCIDTLSDLIKSGIQPIIVKESETLDYLKYLAAQDPIVKEWLQAQDQEKLLSSNMEYLELDGYKPILSGEKALIIADFTLSLLLEQFLKLEPQNKMFLVKNGGLYFSQHALRFDYTHFIFNTSWSRSKPQLHEDLHLCFEPWFETQPMKYLDFTKHYLIDEVKWKRPMKSTTDLDLSSVSVPFYFLFTLLSGTVAAVITEIFFNHCA